MFIFLKFIHNLASELVKYAHGKIHSQLGFWRVRASTKFDGNQPFKNQVWQVDHRTKKINQVSSSSKTTKQKNTKTNII